MLGNFSFFWSAAESADFFKINLLKSFRNAINVFNSLHPDQDRHSVGPDLGLNYLRRLSADEVAAGKESYRRIARIEFKIFNLLCLK